jgi:CoA:oxalate CoA-transferase
MSGPFSGLLVLDMTHVLNGPFGALFLADLGARVIKIEPPVRGDDTRAFGPYVRGESLYYDFINRGKESVVLDLKDEAHRAIFLNMVRRADILTENFRATTMDNLGFSYDALSKINPRLIFASSSGFGHTGPLRDYPAYDTIIQGMSGLMSITGFSDGPPTRVGTSVSDLIAGLYMFSGIASALYAREKTGKGCHIDIAMFDGTLSFLEQALMEYSATGVAPGRIGNRHPLQAPFGVFGTADSHVAICCGNDHLFGLLCRAIGRPELISDERFSSNVKRTGNHALLTQELENALTKQPAAHWLKVIHEAGVPIGPILNVAEAVALPQTKARNMWIEAGGIHMPGNPIKISGYDDPTVRPGAPKLDQHGEAIRREFAVAAMKPELALK